MFYATDPGAFLELAADARKTFGLDGLVVVDGHLPPRAPVDDLAALVEINQAIGVLIGIGHTQSGARALLDQRAADIGSTRRQAAQQILGSVVADPHA